MLNRWRDRRDEEGSDADAGGADAPSADPTRDHADEGNGSSPSVQHAVEDVGAPENADGGPSGDGDALAAELAELKDRHLRLAAEFENFRKRTRKEATTGRTLAQTELVRQILPTLDDLARVADTPHESTTVQALDEGIELILRNLRKQLEDAGLTRIEALDEPFDPERHEAVTAVAVEDPALDGTVSRVFVDGYEFLGRLVRPAQVEVRRHDGAAPGADTE